MFLAASALALFWAFVAYLTKGYQQWLRHVLLTVLVVFCLLTAVELGLGLITGDGLNDSVFFHLRTGLSGGDVSQYAFQLATGVGLFATICGLVWWFRDRLIGGSFERTHAWDALVFAFAILSFVIHPAVVATAKYSLRFTFVQQNDQGFHHPYVADVSDNPKNLVMIYLEGFERTYFDENLFPGLITRLRVHERNGVSFTDIGQTIGTGFTVGGMVASQCGAPLILTGGENSMRVNRFLAGARCLGDVLDDAGYDLTYLGGASLEFAGKGAFYESHGFDTVVGLDEHLRAGVDPAYTAEWGLQDDTLFDLARARYEQLSAGEAPFGLTILTLDTHHPSGHGDTNRSCAGIQYQDGQNPMLNSVKCVDALVGKFVDDLLASLGADQTVIAVMSDHLGLGNSATSILSRGLRRNLFFLIDPDQSEPRQYGQSGTTLDIGPTLLSSLGISVAKMGFGVDLAGPHSTLPEELDTANLWNSKLDQHLLGYQTIYTRLWDFPDVSNGLYVNVEKGDAQFGASSFRMPVLMTFDDDLGVDQVTLGEIAAEDTLTEAVMEFASGTRFLWFDKCAALAPLSMEKSAKLNNDVCIARGVRDANVDVTPVTQSSFWTVDDLSNWLGVAEDYLDVDRQNDALLAIGRARGELPVRLKLPSISEFSGNVVIHSAAFGAGPSFVGTSTQAQPQIAQNLNLPRGLSLIELSADGTPKVLDTLDNCARDWDPGAREPWQKRIVATGSMSSAHVIVVHDTAFCDALDSSMIGVLAGLPLIELRKSKMRQAYVAVIDRDGRVFEFPNRAFPKIRIALNGDQGDPVSFGFLDIAGIVENDTASADLPEPTVTRQLETPVAVAGTLTPQAPIGECLAPPLLSVSRPQEVLNIGGSAVGWDMDSYLDFSMGWWDSERAGRWAGAEHTRLSLILPESENDRLILELGISTPKDFDRTLLIASNGQILAEQKLLTNSKISLDVSALPRGNLVDLDLYVDGVGISCPKERNDADDTRQLAYMLKFIRLSTEVEPKKASLEIQKWPGVWDESAAETFAKKEPLQFEKTAFVIQASSKGTVTKALNAKPNGQPQSCHFPKAQIGSDIDLVPLPLTKELPINSATALKSITFEDGWWPEEERGRWMATNDAEISISLPLEPKNLWLTFRAAPFSTSPITFTVRHQAIEIAKLNITKGQPFSIALDELPRGRKIKISFRIDGVSPSCPSIRDGAGDARALTMMLKTVSLWSNDRPWTNDMIAHGGGRLDGGAITNSLEALRENFHNFNSFEVDLNWTSDGELVCIHDWNESAQARLGSHTGEPIALSDFRQRIVESPRRPQNCDLETLAAWMRMNASKRVVTDVKSQALRAHNLIAERYPDIRHQFIAQAFFPEEITAFRQLGFHDVIWTLYRFGSDSDRVSRELEIHEPSALAMPMEMVTSGLLKKIIADFELPVFVHTINDPMLAACLMGLGAGGLYSDDLSISDLSSIPDPEPNCLQNFTN